MKRLDVRLNFLGEEGKRLLQDAVGKRERAGLSCSCELHVLKEEVLRDDR